MSPVRARLAVLALALAVAASLPFNGSAMLLAVGASFAVGRLASPPVIVLAGALAAAGLTGTAALDGSSYAAANDFVWFAAVEVGMPALVGRLVALRRERAARLRLRAAQLTAERDREARVAELEERARLGADLETLVAHRVAEIALQAAGAERIADDEPDRARAALSQIEAAARAILADIRELLGWLRRPEPVPGAPAAVAVSPAHRLDAALAFGLAVAVAVEAAGSDVRHGGLARNAVLIVAMTAPLAWRRRRPVLVAAAILAAMAGMDAVATPVTSMVSPVVLVALLPYTIAVTLPRGQALCGLAVTIAGGAALEVRGSHTGEIAAAAATSALGAAAWVAGRWVRSHDADVFALDRSAARLLAERDAASRFAAATERARVARELHDVSAHAMTAVVLQAGAAQRVWYADPSAARAATAAIGDLAREALAHLREGLPALGGPADFHALARQARANGLDVSLRVEAASLPAVVERTAYRTVQEALTNAARHAAGSAVDVRVHSGNGDLVVEILDDGGRPARAGTGGHGLRGMRERVEATGGQLHAGPRPGGGFEVRATLPL